MIEPGQFGRSAPGESWRRAMEEVAERYAMGGKGRYRVYARQIEPGWWAYEVGKAKAPPPSRVPMSKARLDELGRTLPRCAQRSRGIHGGNSKLAMTDERTAQEVAAFLGAHAYRCLLPAPAIGEHWHVSTSKKRRKRW